MLTAGDNLQNVTETQFYLAYKGNIPLSDSNNLPLFELEANLNMLIKDLKAQQEAMRNTK